MENKESLIKDLKSLLCPPGSGVYTVNTAKERKEELQKKLYGDKLDAQSAWENSLNSLPQKNVFIFGMASDCGGGILRGANWGPLFLRSSLYKQNLPDNVMDLGDIRVIPHLQHDKYVSEKTLKSCRQALYQDDNSPYPVSPLSIAEYSLKALYQNHPAAKVFTIGGDHSISYPAVKTFLQHKKAQGIKAAVIHFDAHTDLLEERLGIDICFGSWCPHILPFLDSPDLLIQLGIRSTGKSQEHWESTFGVKQYWANTIKTEGIDSVISKIKTHLESKGVQEIYISLDIDALDMKFASATGTPEIEGMTPEDISKTIDQLGAQYKVSGADLAEIAPFVHHPDSTAIEPQTTLDNATPLSRQMIQLMSEN